MTPLLRQQISTQISMLGERYGDGLYNSPVYAQCLPASQARQWQVGEKGEGGVRAEVRETRRAERGRLARRWRR